MWHGIGHGLDEAFFMFWQTLWALILGFALSGAVQAFVSRQQMQHALGDHGPAALARSGFFGAVSSSCSYASSALAKTLFARGADFTAAMVFMVASTNLVLELGIVIWLLLGWQFALGELVGGLILIAILGLVLPRAIPAAWTQAARTRLAAQDAEPEAGASPARMRTRQGWTDASGYTISDLTMVRRELVLGFLIAGFLAALVPVSFWNSLFLTGHGFLSDVENALLGPLLAILSFVCSVGNVPLAATLWHGGISFGGVLSFIFADLITLPLLLIYRRYFGTAITLRLLVVFWSVMSLTGLLTQYLFRAVGITLPTRPEVVVPTGFEWDYTTVLNLIALVAFAGLYVLHRTGAKNDRFATDPACGMQVEKALAPAKSTINGQAYWFCSEHCQQHFSHQNAGHE